MRDWTQLRGERVVENRSYAVVASDLPPHELYGSPAAARIRAFVDYGGGGTFEPITK